MSKAVFFLDIDDCLIYTSRLRPIHLEVVQKSLNELKVKKAREITLEFAASFGRLYSLHQGKKLSTADKKLLDNWLQEVKEIEKPIVEKYGEIKRWSREVGIYLAAMKYDIRLSNNDLIYITNNLWHKISQTATFYPDALPFLRSLQQRQLPFYLITSSDCRLLLDDKTGFFHYNPDYSRSLKLKRLKLLKDTVAAENIFIADPYDKPNPWIFQKAMEKAKKDLKSNDFTSVMIGDSVESDLIPARKAGMDRFFWLKQDSAKKSGKMDDKIIVIKSLDLLPQKFTS